MNKKKLKAIKQLAQRLPHSVEVQKYYSIIQGKEFTIEQLAEMRGKGVELEIEAENWYRENKHKLVVINHYNRLKKAYSRNKEQGLIDYIQWLDRHNKQMNELFKELNLKGVENPILEIARRGVKAFWSNLINFLLAFLAVFQTKKVE